MLAAKIEGRRVSFNVTDILESLGHDDLVDLIDSLACQDLVIKHVTDQILDGYTEHGSHGFRGGAEPSPRIGLDDARRRIARASNDVARAEIDRLVEALAKSEAEAADLRKTINEWRDTSRRSVSF